MRGRAAAVAGALLVAAGAAAVAYRAAHTWHAEIPRVWDEAALAGWATPLAGLGEAPTHMSPADYYAIPEENLRSYPLYMPDREPPGYFERLAELGTGVADRASEAQDAGGLDRGGPARVPRFRRAEDL